MKKGIEKNCYENLKEESCGLLCFLNKRTRIIPCYNWAEDKSNAFRIETRDYVKASKAGEIFGIYHSHVNQNAEFSDKDILHCEELGVPYFVYSLKTKEHNVYIPGSLKKGSSSFANFLKRIKKSFSVNSTKG